jgi:predicted dehydrogenase
VFIGPAPMRPYHPTYHPLTWRSWWDFGSGMLGDRGVHTLDVVHWAMKLGHPETIRSHSSNMNDDTYPLTAIVDYHYPAREGMPPLRLVWYDGIRPPQLEIMEPGMTMGHAEGGVVFYGDEGAIICGIYAEGPRILPKARQEAVGKPPKMIERVGASIQKDWARAIKEGGEPTAQFDYSARLTEMMNLGNVAKKMDRMTLKWDGEAMAFDNDAANKLLAPPYREGWSLEA